ncbi:hypothetical protein FRC12_018753 [Ceratobasidium sp. 428]|nr:hypothetical protein FRC12_018753 [Ceratobasidium sp. 428]
MAIYGWSHFATKSGEDVTTVKQMWSEPVCRSADRLLFMFLEAEDKFEANSAQSLYQEFIDLAFGIVPDRSSMNLRKLLGNIGRAYYAQASVLIALCDKAVEFANAARLDPQWVEDILQALDQTSEALTKAAKSANDGAGVLGLPHWIPHKEGQEYDQDERSVQFQTTLTTIRGFHGSETGPQLVPQLVPQLGLKSDVRVKR